MKLFLALIIQLITYNVYAQSIGNSIYNMPFATYQGASITTQYNNQVELQADIMINMKATSYTAIFSVTQNGLTSTITDSLMSMRLDLVKDGLAQIGISEDNIHIDVISFVPIYSLELERKKFSNTVNEIPTGLQMKKNIHILFYDHNQLSKIIALMAKAEIYDIVKVDYNLADIQAAHNALRKAAIEIINTKKEMYNKLGLHLDVENMADGFGAAYPIERYANYTAFHMGNSIEEVKAAKRRKKIAKNIYINGRRTTVNINNIDIDDTKFIKKQSAKNKTIYYKRIPYNKFDLVLNADFTEARIQIYYTLKVRHTVMNMAKYDKLKEQEKEKQLSLNTQQQQQKKKKKGWFR
ncbi:MAG: SIMPL domain-containing protein [Bacteroidales bacterium]|nr:SIMPL domain-containing protein [Bacteroidales bacterium]